jgi:hypothetical protein
MYAAAAVHLITGIALPWIGEQAIFETYHRHTEFPFWGLDAPSAARAQQVWWIALFGATIQGLSLWMGALVYFGERYGSRFAWAMLILGLLVWAPQDILISLRADNWIHVCADGFALLAMLPPLFWLYWHDLKAGAPSLKNTAAR